MNWPQNTKILRVDGRDSLLIVRSPAAGLSYDRFDHEYTSELLRSALVAAVSALDRYMHDLVVSKCWSFLNKPDKHIPKSLKELAVPALVTAKALKTLRGDSESRPGYLVKKAIQDVLHRDLYQGSAGIERCMGLMGEKKYWDRLSDKMPETMTSKELRRRLNNIVTRRNQIVHEADLERKIKGRQDTLRPITRTQSYRAVSLIADLVSAIDEIV